MPEGGAVCFILSDSNVSNEQDGLWSSTGSTRILRDSVYDSDAESHCLESGNEGDTFHFFRQRTLKYI